MKVSVLINNHNYGRYIAEAIESVLNQTYKDIELIIVDGDSSDESRDVVNSYVKKYPKLITFLQKTTSGQADAINIGYQLSKGDIICLLDSDDYFYPNKIEKIVEYHKHNDTIATSYKCKYTDNMLAGIKFEEDYLSNRKELLKNYGYINTYGITTSCLSMNRKMADKILPIPTRFITYADYYIKLMSVYYGQFKVIDEPLTYYRIHKKQETFKDSFTMDELIEAVILPTFQEANSRLEKLGMEKISMFTPFNISQGFSLANPHMRLKKGLKAAIYGSGSYADKIYELTNALGVEYIFCIDSFSDKWGKLWKNIPIVSPAEVKERRSEVDIIIIASSYEKEVIKKLVEQGLKEDEDFVCVRSFPFN